MARKLQRLTGGTSDGHFVAGPPFPPGDFAEVSNFYDPVKDITDLLMLGQIRRDMYAGGNNVDGLDASSAGDVYLVPLWVPIVVDNTNGQLTNFSDGFGATLVIRFKYRIRLSRVGPTFTPKVFKEGVGAATISGAVACGATNTDWSGSNQLQNIDLTVPTGVTTFYAMGTIAGTPLAGDQAFIQVTYDCYIQS